MTDRPRKEDPSRGTVPSNRLSHGLSSRAFMESRKRQATEFSELLLGDAPRTYTVVDAALSLAEAFLHLAAIRRAKLTLMEEGSARPKDLDQPGYPSPASAHASSLAGCHLQRRAHKASSPNEEETEAGIEAVLRAISQNNGSAFARLLEYERKAISRRNRLMTRLEYLVIEARRDLRNSRIAVSRIASRGLKTKS